MFVTALASSAKLISREGIIYTGFDDLCTGIAGTSEGDNAIIDGEFARGLKRMSPLE